MVRLKDQLRNVFAHCGVFQFQYGTIKSLPFPLVILLPLYFNSSMVRLKEWDRHWLKWHQENFNSSMVRLKETLVFKAICSRRFQFQYGTIKRRLSAVHLMTSIWFQFQYGTIKSHSYLPLLVCVLDFNSSMVRLKAKRGKWWDNSIRFQFQYGTIKSRQQRNKVFWFCSISIPVWYD